MNVIKHMEVAFVVSLAVAGLAAVAVDSIPAAQAQGQAQMQMQTRAAAVQPGIPVVHVSAKRMTAIEKLQSLALERTHKRA
jgi:hypothetical protein